VNNSNFYPFSRYRDIADYWSNFRHRPSSTPGICLTHSLGVSWSAKFGLKKLSSSV